MILNGMLLFTTKEIMFLAIIQVIYNNNLFKQKHSIFLKNMFSFLQNSKSYLSNDFSFSSRNYINFHKIIFIYMKTLKRKLSNMYGDSKKYQQRKNSSALQQYLSQENASDRTLNIIQSYINANIKSKRKSVLNLYSESLGNSSKDELKQFPNINKSSKYMSVRNKNQHKFTINYLDYQKSLSRRISKQKALIANDKDIIVNSKFTTKKTKILEQKIQEPTYQYLKPNDNVSRTLALKQISLKKQTNIAKLEKLPKINENKYEKRRKTDKKIAYSQAYINPWQSMQANHQQIMFKAEI